MYIHNKHRHYTTAQTKTLFVHTFSIQTYEMLCPLVSMQINALVENKMYKHDNKWCYIHELNL
jgi:hypothetical protein